MGAVQSVSQTYSSSSHPKIPFCQHDEFLEEDAYVFQSGNFGDFTIKMSKDEKRTVFQILQLMGIDAVEWFIQNTLYDHTPRLSMEVLEAPELETDYPTSSYEDSIYGRDEDETTIPLADNISVTDSIEHASECTLEGMENVSVTELCEFFESMEIASTNSSFDDGSCSTETNSFKEHVIRVHSGLSKSLVLTPSDPSRSSSMSSSSFNLLDGTIPMCSETSEKTGGISSPRSSPTRSIQKLEVDSNLKICSFIQKNFNSPFTCATHHWCEKVDNIHPK